MSRKGQGKSGGLRGQDLKDFRRKVAVLKAKGVVSKRVDARSQKATRYMRDKVRKFQDVISGDVSAVRAKPDIRAKYDGLIEQRGSFLLVPKERAKERVKIARGLIEIDRPMIGPTGLKFGEEREVILPFKLVDMPQLVERLQTDETLDGLKRGDEMFAFKIDGWASKMGFADAKEMGDYISRNYAHLFKPGNMRQVVKYLSFVRYRNYGNERASEGPHRGYAMKGRPQKKANKWDVERRRNRDAIRKAEQRARESETDKAKRLEQQRIRQAQYRQTKFEQD